MSDFGKFWGSGFGKGMAGYLSGSLHIREFVALDGTHINEPPRSRAAGYQPNLALLGITPVAAT